MDNDFTRAMKAMARHAWMNTGCRIELLRDGFAISHARHGLTRTKIVTFDEMDHMLINPGMRAIDELMKQVTAEALKLMEQNPNTLKGRCQYMEPSDSQCMNHQTIRYKGHNYCMRHARAAGYTGK